MNRYEQRCGKKDVHHSLCETLSYPTIMWAAAVTWSMARMWVERPGKDRIVGRWLTVGVISYHLCSTMVLHSGLLSQTICLLCPKYVLSPLSAGAQLSPVLLRWLFSCHVFVERLFGFTSQKKPLGWEVNIFKNIKKSSCLLSRLSEVERQC